MPAGGSDRSVLIVPLEGMVSIPMCSTRKRSLCVSGMAEHSGLLSTFRVDENPHNKVKAESAQGAALHLPGRGSWAKPELRHFPALTWNELCLFPLAQSHTESFSWGTSVQLIPQHSSTCRLWKISKSKHLLAKHAEENSAF